MEDISALTDAERAFLVELKSRGVRFVVVGLGAAVLQGANTSTQDIDLWFEHTSDPRIGEAARAVGGIWVSGSFGMRPPQIGGEIGHRMDVVTHMHGLGSFADEIENMIELEVDGTMLPVLKLERIIASKRAAGRTKDLSVIPALEEALAARSGGHSDRG